MPLKKGASSPHRKDVYLSASSSYAVAQRNKQRRPFGFIVCLQLSAPIRRHLVSPFLSRTFFHALLTILYALALHCSQSSYDQASSRLLSELGSPIPEVQYPNLRQLPQTPPLDMQIEVPSPTPSKTPMAEDDSGSIMLRKSEISDPQLRRLYNSIIVARIWARNIAERHQIDEREDWPDKPRTRRIIMNSRDLLRYLRDIAVRLHRIRTEPIPKSHDTAFNRLLRADGKRQANHLLRVVYLTMARLTTVMMSWPMHCEADVGKMSEQQLKVYRGLLEVQVKNAAFDVDRGYWESRIGAIETVQGRVAKGTTSRGVKVKRGRK